MIKQNRDEANVFRNLRWLISSLSKAGEVEPLISRYPALAPLLETVVRDDLEDARILGSAAELFLEIRASTPPERDFLDLLVINSAKLDMHKLTIEPPERYWYDDSDGDRNLRNMVSQRVQLPFWTANYLSHLSVSHKFLYIATPKVGCTTLKRCLQQGQLGGNIRYRHYGEEHDGVLAPLLQPVDHVQAFLAALDDNEYFRFTFVRNPFSRALSCYIDKILNSKLERDRLLPQLGIAATDDPPTFAQFLQAIAQQAPEERDYHWAEQSWLTQPDAINYDFVGRFERFDHDFQYICCRTGVAPSVDAIAHSTRASERYPEFYGAEEADLVRTIYMSDFERFGYDSRLN